MVPRAQQARYFFLLTATPKQTSSAYARFKFSTGSGKGEDFFLCNIFQVVLLQ